MPRWVLMWTIASALYAGCKYLTYARVRGRGKRPVRGRLLGYLIFWPGMDAEAFLGRHEASVAPPTREWLASGLKIALGIVLTWVLARQAWPGHPLLTGWIGMIGAIFILHFGTFHLLSLAWRRAGINAVPLMRSPIRSTSLSEFWGRRWNTAFHELATRFTFKPLRPWVGATAATLTTFLASGLIHELVITVPAGGGYGLPTGYFILQGLGVAGERSGPGRSIGLGRGWRGWIFTAAVTAGPAYWLFPPPFIRQIILPMLGAIGAV